MFGRSVLCIYDNQTNRHQGITQTDLTIYGQQADTRPKMKEMKTNLIQKTKTNNKNNNNTEQHK